MPVKLIAERFPVIEPTNLNFPWLLAFTTLAEHREERFDFMAGKGEAQRRELEAALAPMAVTWLTLEHGATIVDLTELPSLRGDSKQTNLPSLRGVSEASDVAIYGSDSIVGGLTQRTDPQFQTSPFPSPHADGAILTTPGHAVAFTTADCLPIICVCEQLRVVAVLHAGWRSLAAGIIESAIQRMQADYGVDPVALKAWVGPAIAQQDYEVSTDTRTALLERPAVTTQLFSPTRPGHWLADLPGAATAILTSLGLPVASIARHPQSTLQSLQLHSARRDGTTSGRMATVVGMTC
ncbi:MAG: polyphenol oxidase family protein [Coriobacteriia bacterium]|nr:polyphenol oxidase family protein [Coriobacteriia bacterium]